MKLLFLGTGAADWSLALFEKYGWGRRFSSALVNDDLLIDPGPHIYDYEEKLGHPGMFRGVKDIILTHSHADHFCPDTVERLCREAAGPIRFWADSHAFAKLAGRELPGLTLVPLTATEEIALADYRVMPCRSNHDLFFTGEQTLNFIVRENATGRSFFYGADSGWIIYDTWLLIKKAKPNAMIFEATVGAHCPGDDRCFGHTSVPMIGLMMETVRVQKGCADDCRYYATHMARTLHGTQEETAADLAPYGVQPAYDGLAIEI